MEPLNCPFCTQETGREIIAESSSAYAIFDRYPVSPGHALIIPRRHCSDYFALSAAEQSACWELVNQVKQILTDKFHPAGFNIGINVGEPAGQTIPHAHIHLIPRYPNDVPDPEGGIRGVIPEKRKYRI